MHNFSLYASSRDNLKQYFFMNLCQCANVVFACGVSVVYIVFGITI